MTTQLPFSQSAPLTDTQKSQILDLVRRASRAEIMPRFRKLDQDDIDTKKDETDLVTEADRATEAMITQGLQAAFPQASLARKPFQPGPRCVTDCLMLS